MNKATPTENSTNEQGNTNWNLHKWTRQHQLKTPQMTKTTPTENSTNDQDNTNWKLHKWPRQHQLKTPQMNKATPTENSTNEQCNSNWKLHKWTRQQQLKTPQMNKTTPTENPTNDQDNTNWKPHKWPRQHQLKTPQMTKTTPTENPTNDQGNTNSNPTNDQDNTKWPLRHHQHKLINTIPRARWRRAARRSAKYLYPSHSKPSTDKMPTMPRQPNSVGRNSSPSGSKIPLDSSEASPRPLWQNTSSGIKMVSPTLTKTNPRANRQPTEEPKLRVSGTKQQTNNQETKKQSTSQPNRLKDQRAIKEPPNQQTNKQSTSQPICVLRAKSASGNLQKHFLSSRGAQQCCRDLQRTGNIVEHNVAATQCVLVSPGSNEHYKRTTDDCRGRTAKSAGAIWK